MKLGQLLDRHIGNLLASENATGENANLMVRLGQISSIADQAAATAGAQCST
jgi:hypothetical protein